MQLRIWRVTIDGAVAHFDSLDTATGCVKGWLSKRSSVTQTEDVQPRVVVEDIFMEQDEYLKLAELEDQA